MTSDKPDLAERLLNAADEVDDLSRTQIQILLRQAAITIQTLRELIGIKNQIVLEDEPPAGRG